MAGKLLKCEVCEFIGPYSATFEHMVLNHDRHSSSAVCHYCKETSLKDHELGNSLNNYYKMYKSREPILLDFQCPAVIQEFYKLIARISAHLGVKIIRHMNFKNCNFMKAFHYNADYNKYEDDDLEMIASYKIIPRFGNRPIKRPIKLDVLDRLLQEAIRFFNKTISLNVTIVTNNPNEPAQSDVFVQRMPDSVTSTSHDYPSPPKTPNIGMNSGMQFGMGPETVPLITPTIYENTHAETHAQSNAEDNMKEYTDFIGTMLKMMPGGEQNIRRAKFQIHQLLLKLHAESLPSQFNF